MKRLNKLLAILLAVTMMMSLAVVVQAVGTASITITSAVEGETYSAWKIFDATDDGNGHYSYSISTEGNFWSAINSAYDSGSGALANFITLTATTDPTVYTVQFKDYVDYATPGYNSDAEYKQAFLDLLTSIVETAITTAPGISATASDVADANGVAEMTDLDAGYYYISTTVGTIVMLDTTNIEIYDKNLEPTTEKTVYDDSTYTSTTDDTDSDAEIGDTVYFQTVIDNIYGVSNLVLYDSMDAGLDYSQIDSVTLCLSDSDTTGTALTLGTGTGTYAVNTADVYFVVDVDATTFTTDGTLYTYDAGNTPQYTQVTTGTYDPTETYYLLGDFSMTFDYSDVTGLTRTAFIVVKYSATVNENAVIYDVENQTGSNDNDTRVSYGNNSWSLMSTTNTYVYSLNVYKYTGTLSDSPEVLSGASFIILDSTGNNYAKFILENGVYRFDEWVAYSGDDNLEANSDPTYYTLITDSTGILNISGLDAETTYQIHETAAPAGYNKLASDVSFVIAGSDNQTTTQGYVSVNGEDPNTTTISGISVAQTAVPIQNNSGSEMPETGGIGTTIFYVVGGILVVGAVVLLITKKRLENKDE